MNRRDSIEYRKQVDDLMKKLRWRCLGLDTPLTVILPEQQKSLPPEGQASCLARQILFHLAAQDPSAEKKELERSFHWLYAIILYLLTECSEEDQIFGNLVRIVELDFFVRSELFMNFGDLVADIRDNLFVPAPLESLELNIISLLVAHTRSKQYKLLFSRLLTVTTSL